MDFQALFPIWDKLSGDERERISAAAQLRTAKKGTLIHGGDAECTGLLLVKSGQLRAFILSDEGREVTIYRLFERDLCLFSAGCIMNSLQFDISIEAEKDCTYYLISPGVYRALMQENAAVANFTNEVMGTRFSEVMWLVEQVMWKSLDKRIAAFLLDEAAIEGTNVLSVTHEALAAHLGTQREVVTRMLRYFKAEGMVELRRGTVELTNEKKLRALSE